MELEDRPNLYDVQTVISFSATDMEEAEDFLDNMIDVLEDKGYSVQTATLSEAVLLED